MNKKLLSLLLVGTMLSTGAAFAQDVPVNDAPESRDVSASTDEKAGYKKFDKKYHEEKAKRIANELGLTQDQQAQADKVREQGRQNIKPLMEQMKKLRQQIDQERRANMDNFEKILTPEQKKSFAEMKKRNRMPGERKGYKHEWKNARPHQMMRDTHPAPEHMPAENKMPPMPVKM